MIKRYRKRSIVEAEQFDGSRESGDKLQLDYDEAEFSDEWSIETKQGKVIVNRLDYIISNPDGERYPCNWQTFEDTYELIDV